MRGSPVAIVAAAAVTISGCTALGTSDAKDTATQTNSAPTKPAPIVPALDMKTGKTALRAFDKSFVSAFNLASGKAHDPGKLDTVMTGAAHAGALYRSVLYKKLDRLTPTATLRTQLLRVWAGPKSTKGPDQVITAAKVAFKGEAKITEHELQVLRRDPGSKAWKSAMTMSVDASTLPDDDVPAPEVLATPAERTKVLALVRNVMAYLDGAKEKGFIAGAALYSHAKVEYDRKVKSKTVLWEDDAVAPTESVVIRRTSEGLLALVATRRKATVTSTTGGVFDLDIHRLMFKGHQTKSYTVTAAVMFALLLKDNAKPAVIAGDSAYVIP